MQIPANFLLDLPVISSTQRAELSRYFDNLRSFNQSQTTFHGINCAGIPTYSFRPAINGFFDDEKRRFAFEMVSSLTPNDPYLTGKMNLLESLNRASTPDFLEFRANAHRTYAQNYLDSTCERKFVFGVLMALTHHNADIVLHATPKFFENALAARPDLHEEGLSPAERKRAAEVTSDRYVSKFYDSVIVLV